MSLFVRFLIVAFFLFTLADKPVTAQNGNSFAYSPGLTFTYDYHNFIGIQVTGVPNQTPITMVFSGYVVRSAGTLFDALYQTKSGGAPLNTPLFNPGLNISLNGDIGGRPITYYSESYVPTFANSGMYTIPLTFTTLTNGNIFFYATYDNGTNLSDQGTYTIKLSPELAPAPEPSTPIALVIGILSLGSFAIIKKRN